MAGVLKNLVEKQPKLPVWLMHMWQRRDAGRLGLILGAGVSRGAGCPLWGELVERLTTEAKLSAELMETHKKAGRAETFLAEVLYRQHLSSERDSYNHIDVMFRPYQIGSAWLDRIHKCLYSEIVGVSFEEIEKRHPYMSALAELIYKARFTVNFNFDDFIDEAVYRHAARIENSINPEVITVPKLENRLGASVIYHINGILPRERIRSRSERIVLTEDAFADVMLSPNSQDSEFVINQFATRTFLLLGLSLSDNSLKNLLRAGAKRNPANHHYIVYWEKDGELRSEAERKDIFEVNLNVYNLISIFLTDQEHAEFISYIEWEG